MDINIKNIEIVVDLLKKNGIRHIVMSPGGTNIPFVKAVQDDEFFTCYSIVDERSAMYFAIGLYLQTGKIIVTSCTSAQATRNYIPGLTEAYYKKVPILAITMAKHPRFMYQEYMQAPDQTSLPEDCVKKSFALPFISDENDIFHSIRMANQAILELTHNGFGPVQLCIPWLDFPLAQCVPEIRQICRFCCNEEWNIDLNAEKIMVIIGEHKPFISADIKAIEMFAEKYNAIIYTNHLSNYAGKYTVSANLSMLTLTPDLFEKKYKPDIIISIGSQTGDYPLYNMISRVEFKGVEHWRVCEDGNVVDTYDKLTKIFESSTSYFFEHFVHEQDTIECNFHLFYKTWNELVKSKTTNIQLPFSNASVAQYLSNRIPDDSIIQFSILNSLRIWNFFDLNSSIECYSNVGAFGIDGGMSTLIGQSVVTDELCFMIIGDLAFFYDMNALGIRHIKNNLRILLINNNGGIEFKLANRDNESIDRYIAASNHYKNAMGWAETCGFKYLSAKTMEEFSRQVDAFVLESDVPILYEIFVSDYNEAEAYKLIIEKNTPQNFSGSIKKTVKKVFGEEKVSQLKKILK